MNARPLDLGAALERLGQDALRLAAGLVEAAEAEALRRMSGRGAIALTPQFVRGLIAARQLRADRLGPILTPEPGWTLMLILYSAHMDGVALSPSRLTALSGLPHGTVVGRLAALEAAALTESRPDPERRRGLLVSLTEDAAERMEGYLMAAREI